jgi:hypothetical protein
MLVDNDGYAFKYVPKDLVINKSVPADHSAPLY